MTVSDCLLLVFIALLCFGIVFGITGFKITGRAIFVWGRPITRWRAVWVCLLLLLVTVALLGLVLLGLFVLIFHPGE